jgi:hypothetical protein
VMAVPMVGEDSIGIRFAWRSFHTVIRWSAFGCTARSGFLVGLLPAGYLHFALVESHAGRVAYQR